ncbi:MAG: hypothetical protein Q4D98_06720 [Planctomycetia bacterium]|nr:hypothetical protein [Planctomycetia bacterium]
MKKGLCFFVGFLLLLIGGQFLLTDRVYLTSQFTHALARRQDPTINKKTWWYEAIYGEKVKIPEKEIAIPESAAYMTMAVASICIMHGLVIRSK